MKKLVFKSLFYFLPSLLLLGSCKGGQQKNEREIKEEYKVEYAQGFSVKKYAEYTEVTVHNPWDSTQVLQNYILIDRNKEKPKNLPKGTVVKVPIKTVVAYSTLHASTLKELESLDIIIGVCEPEYMKIDEIQEGIKDGKIVALGMASSPDVEQIIDLNPEAILASPISGQTYGNVVNTKIPIIETPDYTETRPLGRTEWIRFYSLFLGKEQLADSLFSTIKKEYNAVKEIAKSAVKHPSVFLDLKYEANWNVSGGKSYIANMISDAGGSYVWSDFDSPHYKPLSFESVLDKAGDADMWLIRYYSPKEMTYTSLKKDYKPYSHFGAYKNKGIWACNTMYSSWYEDLPIHPEAILKDLATVFNPELFPNYTPLYFKPLAD